MPDSRRIWTEDDTAKLKSMAGKLALREIAKELGRTPGATAVQASKLGLSLSRRPVVRRENAQAKDRLTFLS